MTTDELLAYYQNLLIIQYKTMPKAVGTIGAVVTEVVADQLFSQVRDGFDPASAIGQQLDVLAAYVGAPRRLAGFTPSGTFMQFPFYADGPTGFSGMALYTDVAVTDVHWKRYSSAASTYVLSDGQLSQLIQFLIAVHASDHTLASIDLILQGFFGVYATVADNQDMTITYTHQSADPNNLFAIVDFLGKLPRPAGVGIIVTTV